MFILRSVHLLVRYFEKFLKVVLFAKVQGQVKLEIPRPGRVSGLLNFAYPNVHYYPRISTNSKSYQKCEAAYFTSHFFISTILELEQKFRLLT
jgi:hypothetical protein